MLRLSCVVHGPIYGRFMGKRLSLYINVHTQVAQARQTSALLRNIRNIRICTGKKPIVSVTYENERISIKKQLTLHKMCVTSLLCGSWADLWPFYGLYCSFSKVTETIGFFPIQILIFRILRNNVDVRRCSYFELGLPVEGE